MPRQGSAQRISPTPGPEHRPAETSARRARHFDDTHHGPRFRPGVFHVRGSGRRKDDDSLPARLEISNTARSAVLTESPTMWVRAANAATARWARLRSSSSKRQCPEAVETCRPFGSPWPLRRQVKLCSPRSACETAGHVDELPSDGLGHDRPSPAVTVNVYQHLMPGMGEAAGARLPRLLAGTTG